jgi:hypothetical protein
MDPFITSLKDLLLPYGWLGVCVFVVLVFTGIWFWEFVKNHFAKDRATHKAKLLNENELTQSTPKLQVKADIMFENTDKMRAFLQINVVNSGERIAYVKKVAAILECRQNYVDGKPVGCIPDSSEIHPKFNELVIEIKPFGDTHEFRLPLYKNPGFKAHLKGNDQFGDGYVELSTGEKINFEFLILPDDSWDILKKPFALPKNAPQIGHRCSRCGSVFLIANPALASPLQSGPYPVTCPNKSCGHVDQINLGK